MAEKKTLRTINDHKRHFEQYKAKVVEHFRNVLESEDHNLCATGISDAIADLGLEDEFPEYVLPRQSGVYEDQSESFWALAFIDGEPKWWQLNAYGPDPEPYGSIGPLTKVE